VFINIFAASCAATCSPPVVAAAKDLQLKVPVVVRMEGTNVEVGQQILRGSGLNLTIADGMKDGAQKSWPSRKVRDEHLVNEKLACSSKASPVAKAPSTLNK